MDLIAPAARNIHAYWLARRAPARDTIDDMRRPIYKALFPAATTHALRLWQEVQALPWSTEIVALTCGIQNCLRPRRPSSSVHGKLVEREGLDPPLRLDGILGDLHDLPLHIKQPPPSIALKDLNLAPIQQEKFGRQFELDSMLGAFFTQSWLDGSSPGDDFVSIALPQRPACLILSPHREVTALLAESR